MLYAIKFSLFLNLILLLEKEAKEGESRCYADIDFYFVKEIY